MRYEEMTKNQRDRVRFQECPMCGGKFTRIDDIQEIKMKYGRSTLHFYFHSSCLLKYRGIPSQLEEGVENEKAK